MRSRLTTVVATTAFMSFALVAPAFAAVPGNDTSAGAVTIATLPFSADVDTRQATTDAEDTALNAQCRAPVTNGSVWYSYTPPAGVNGLLVDVSASDYSSGAIIAEPNGTGGWYVDACGPGATGTRVSPGVTYRILAFSDTPGITGGTLRLRASQAIVPTVSATVNPRGKVDSYGNALISGTVTCTGGDFVALDTHVVQPVGRFSISGDGYTGQNGCDGRAHPWTSVVVPYNGKFAGGKAATFTFAFTCGSVFCADTYVQQTVRLSR